MKRCWRCKCEKEVSEFGSNASRKDGLNPCCRPCAREASVEWRLKNPDGRKAIHAKYRANNIDKCRQAQAAWRTHDVERARLVKQMWSQKNQATVRVSKKAWLERNPLAQVVRKKRLRRSTPPWADLKAVAAVYLEARRLSIETGVPHDVDHIVPLHGRTVCGLHVHWNLRPLPAALNKAKSNRWDAVASGVETVP